MLMIADRKGVADVVDPTLEKDDRDRFPAAFTNPPKTRLLPASKPNNSRLFPYHESIIMGMLT